MADETTPAAGQPSAQTGVWTDPYRAYNFKLEIQGVVEGHFFECSGLSIKVHTIAYREGGNAQVVHKLPGQVEYGELTLRWGLTSSQELWRWFQTTVSGKVDRRNVSVVVLDSDGVGEVMRWNLINAWLSEWHGPALNALSKDVAIGRVTLVTETVTGE